jgi:hypothetical protein
VKFEFPAVPAGSGDARSRGEPDSFVWPDAQPAASGTPSTQEVILLFFLLMEDAFLKMVSFVRENAFYAGKSTWYPMSKNSVTNPGKI